MLNRLYLNTLKVKIWFELAENLSSDKYDDLVVISCRGRHFKILSIFQRNGFVFHPSMQKSMDSLTVKRQQMLRIKTADNFVFISGFMILDLDSIDRSINLLTWRIKFEHMLNSLKRGK